MSQTTISALPDLPLRNIFNRLSLNDQINGVRRVCVRWRVLLQSELDHRRSLVLTHNNDQNESLNSLREDKLHCGQLLQHVRHDDGSPLVRLLSLEQFKYDFISIRFAIRGPALMDALPRITNLTVVCKNISPVFLRKLIPMLNHWANSLVSLKLNLERLYQFNSYNDETLLSLFNAINQLHSLRHLKFNLTRADGYKCFFLPILKLEIVSRLSTLCVQGGIEPELFFNTLAQYGSANLRQVCYHVYQNDYLQFGLKHPRLANCFTGLYTCELKWSIWNERTNQRMQQFCAQYSSLTTLALEMEPSALFGLAQHLSRLQSLITLKLSISECIFARNDKAGFAHGWPISNENPVQLSQVCSVRLLDLILTTASHENVSALQFPIIFPNIQVVRLTHHSRQCSACQYVFGPRDAALNKEMQDTTSECMRLARESFRACAHLNTIEYNQNPFCYPDPSMRLISPPEW